MEKKLKACKERNLNRNVAANPMNFCLDVATGLAGGCEISSPSAHSRPVFEGRALLASSLDKRAKF